MYSQVNKWFETARRQARGASAETPNCWRRRGRPPTKNADKAVASISGVNTGFTAPYTPNSAMNVQSSPIKSLGMTNPASTINAQKSPSRNVGTMVPNSSVNVQKTPPASAGMSEGANMSKDFMDSERKKAIMRELRKQKMGR
jgi:hypothetical protein